MSDRAPSTYTPSSRLHAWLELCRLSNAPTIVSNVLTGSAIGALAPPPEGQPLQWPHITLLTLAMLLLYVGGMALNDVVDAPSDRTQRPTRPIPSGRINRGGALAFANLSLALGLSIIAYLSIPAIAPAVTLVACIVIYDLTHKLTSASVVLMGACRAFVYVTCAIAVAQPPVTTVLSWLAGALGLYVATLTFIAQRETGLTIDARRYLAFALPVIALAPAPALGRDWNGWAIAAASLIVVLSAIAVRALFTAKPQAAVMGLLAMICLMDAFYLALLEQIAFAAAALGCFAITTAAHRYIPGT